MLRAFEDELVKCAEVVTLPLHVPKAFWRAFYGWEGMGKHAENPIQKPTFGSHLKPFNQNLVSGYHPAPNVPLPPVGTMPVPKHKPGNIVPVSGGHKFSDYKPTFKYDFNRSSKQHTERVHQGEMLRKKIRDEAKKKNDEVMKNFVERNEMNVIFRYPPISEDELKA